MAERQNRDILLLKNEVGMGLMLSSFFRGCILYFFDGVKKVGVKKIGYFC